MDNFLFVGRRTENTLDSNLDCGFVASTTKKANLISMISLLQVAMLVFMISVTIIKTTLANRQTTNLEHHHQQIAASTSTSIHENNMVEVDSSYKGRPTVLIETGNLNMVDAAIAEHVNPPVVSPYIAPENIDSLSDSQ